MIIYRTLYQPGHTLLFNNMGITRDDGFHWLIKKEMELLMVVTTEVAVVISVT